MLRWLAGQEGRGLHVKSQDVLGKIVRHRTDASLNLFLSPLGFTVALISLRRVHDAVVDVEADEVGLAAPFNPIVLTINVIVDGDCHVLLVGFVDQVVLLDVGQRHAVDRKEDCLNECSLTHTVTRSAATLI